MSAIDRVPIGEVATKRITVLQGDALATGSAEIEYSTVLGSCVATCMYDPVARIGGMNHFLLAEPPKHLSQVEFDEHYGVFLMELLINEMLKLGAVKSRIKSRVYGGANMNARLADIGGANAAFATQFLAQEGIDLVFQDLGGNDARRVNFLPATGRLRCRVAASTAIPSEKPQVRPQSDVGQVELF